MTIKKLPNDNLEAILAATVQAVEESIIDAMIVAETMNGIENYKVTELPYDQIRAVQTTLNGSTAP